MTSRSYHPPEIALETKIVGTIWRVLRNEQHGNVMVYKNININSKPNINN